MAEEGSAGPLADGVVRPRGHNVNKGRLSICPCERVTESGMAARMTGLQKAIAIMGGINPLAKALGIDRAAIHRWHQVPSKRIIQIEHLTGVPREELRPDLYLAPRPNPKKLATKQR